jgi:hypothetical protein
MVNALALKGIVCICSLVPQPGWIGASLFIRNDGQERG